MIPLCPWIEHTPYDVVKSAERIWRHSVFMVKRPPSYDGIKCAMSLSWDLVLPRLISSRIFWRIISWEFFDGLTRRVSWYFRKFHPRRSNPGKYELYTFSHQITLVHVCWKNWK
jgi:hypothetical protein